MLITVILIFLIRKIFVNANQIFKETLKDMITIQDLDAPSSPTTNYVPQKRKQGGAKAVKVAKKDMWRAEEDLRLMQIIDMHSARNWNEISNILKGRSAKQCRQRWHNNLDPLFKRCKWSKAEEKALFLLHKIHGTQWAKIAKALGNRRTDNAIKNYWNCHLNSQANIQKTC